jgi:hypothetical protein
MERASSRARVVGTALVVLGVVATTLTACGGDPTVPELTDPTEILTAAATTTATATSVRADLTADGELSLGVGGATAPFLLDDATANAEIDLAAGEGRATFAIPGILGLRGEVIVVDGTAYAKTTLTGPQYVVAPIGAVDPSPSSSAAPDTASMLAALTEFLARPELAPVKGDDTDCAAGTCYAVTVELTADEVAALLGEAGGGGGLDLPIPGGLPIPMPDLSSISSLDVTALVDKATTRLSGLRLVASSGGESGSSAAPSEATVEVRFTGWDEDVSVEAPPADQVQGGG